MNGHFDAAGALLDAGADPNIADAVGRTPLYAAVDMNTVPSSNRPGPKTLENQMTGLEIMAKLLDNGANPNARLKKQTPYRTKVDRGSDTMLGAGTTPSCGPPAPATRRPCACFSSAAPTRRSRLAATPRWTSTLVRSGSPAASTR